jgi:two-component system sensor histidine kinase CpxA
MKLAMFNPFNSLFGRVFLWFWTALLVILLSAFFLTKQLSDVLEVNAASEEQASNAAMTIKRLSRLMDRSNNLDQAFRRLGQHKRMHLVAINIKTQKIHLSFPQPLSGNVGELKEFVESDSPLLIQVNNMEFIGPFDLSFKGSDYEIFVGRLLLRSERNVMSRSKVAIAGLVLAIFLSTLFCFALVMSITKPLGALRLASNRLAKGDLNTRIEGLEKRKDEVGNLASDFNTMAARLQNLIDNQKQLMANVSHELRTPLTRLQLAVALLEDELVLGSESASNQSNSKQLARIENEIIKMDQMIGQVLTLAKINTSQQQIDLQETPLSSIFDNLLKDARFEAEATQKSLIVGQVPEANIEADIRLLVSAFENIIRNAIRFSSTQVKCDFRLDDSGLGEKYVEVCISDDGAGMSETEVEAVFNPFFRGSHQVKEISKGAGLGLSIAKAAIELHGGSIQAKICSQDANTSSEALVSERSFEEKSPLSGLSVIIRLPITSQTT